MTSEQARRIAQEVSGRIVGAGASETQRLGYLAARTINWLADRLDELDPPKLESGGYGDWVVDVPAPEPEPAPKSRRRPAQAHDRKTNA